MKTKLQQHILRLIIKMQAWLEHLRLKIVKKDFLRATEQDIYYSYRLFLNRRPDAGGFETYKRLINQAGGVRIDYLTDAFLYCAEQQELQAKRSQPVLVELAEFQQYVRLNDHFIGAAIARDKHYEVNVSQVLRELLRPGITFLDIGANIGYFSLLAAAHLENTGRVIAFEPVAENRELFALSVAVNDFQNIEIHPYAVSDHEAVVALEMGARNSNSRMIDPDLGSDVYQQVKTVVLDHYLTDLNTLDIVKIDIEGAEPLALKGMGELIEQFRPLIITEFSPKLIVQTSQANPESYLAALVELGYTLAIIDGSARETGILTLDQIMLQFEKEPGLAHLDLLATPTH
ncbi:MAG: FkbM family methyltransferase [Candidatus Promineifilaceae bacterium]|nr:FkbM family methyltransferase [Candidatus Promineifilaceae bacterium]